MTTARAAYLSLGLLAAFAAVARAEDQKPAEPKGAEIKSPWSVDSVTKSDGYFGSSSTTLKRDMGEGWSLGGKMTTPYEDQRIGGRPPEHLLEGNAVQSELGVPREQAVRKVERLPVEQIDQAIDCRRIVCDAP